MSGDLTSDVAAGVRSGSMFTLDRQTIVPIPLQSTDVRASITGMVSAVHVTQTFANPFGTKIEAVYVFPLPENAAISDFMMTIGDRRIRGVIRERAEAERIYGEARAQGHVTSLMSQERANIFTQRVANIEPGRSIDVAITYFGTVACIDGWYEFVFPMSIGPRFNPPHSSGSRGDGIGAVTNGAGDSNGQRTEVPYLAPGTATGHAVSISVEMQTGIEIAALESVNHAIRAEQPGEGRAVVRLVGNRAEEEKRPAPEVRATGVDNRDFVLRYRLADDRLRSVLIAQEEGPGSQSRGATNGPKPDGYFTLFIAPPASNADLPRQPMELVFVLDCSGSMEGAPLEQAKNAIEEGLSLLEPRDSFQIISFSQSASALGNRPLEATPENVLAGRRYLETLVSSGGTYMIEGMRAALNFPRDRDRTRYVVFLTDGFIGNETEVLSELGTRLKGSRVFSFGVGSAPNRALMDAMARIGRGAVAYLSLNDDARDVMRVFFESASRPAMTDLRVVSAPGTSFAELYPGASLPHQRNSITRGAPFHFPDVFAGRPVMLTGRYNGELPTEITLKGRQGGEEITLSVPVERAPSGVAAGTLRRVWARGKITAIAEQALYVPGLTDAPKAIRTVALEHGLVSSQTSMLAVDASGVTAGDYGVSVDTPTPVPQGVRYDTTVKQTPTGPKQPPEPGGPVRDW